MLKFLRKLFAKAPIHPTFENKSFEFNEATYKAEKRAEKVRDKISKIKLQQEVISKKYDDKLKSILTLYANKLSTDAVANKMYFEEYNKEWKELTLKANTLQKYVKVNPLAFDINAKTLLNTLKANQK